MLALTLSLLRMSHKKKPSNWMPPEQASPGGARAVPASSSLDAKAAPCRRIGRPPTLAASPRANVCLVSAFAPSVYPCRSIHSELNLIACFLCSSRCCCTRARAHTSLILVRTRFVLHSPARPHNFCPLPPPACALRTAWVNPAMMTTMHRWTICPPPTLSPPPPSPTHAHNAMRFFA